MPTSCARVVSTFMASDIKRGKKFDVCPPSAILPHSLIHLKILIGLMSKLFSYSVDNFMMGGFLVEVGGGLFRDVILA